MAVSGGIAAYKSCEIASQLTKLKINTQCLLTENALQFIRPLTLESITGNRCYSSQFNYDLLTPLHIELARIHDLLLIAPATANVIAKLACGICDDLLGSVVCAFSPKKKILIAPAMNTQMWENPILQKNISKLTEELNVDWILPEYGELACKTEGIGKLAPPERIVFYLKEALQQKESQPLKKQTVLITLGGLRESLDPVRFLGNRGSGKMGLALAKEAHRLGAKKIKLISGNPKLKALAPDFFYYLEEKKLLEVSFAENFSEFKKLLFESFSQSDILFMTAAVTDFSPRYFCPQKIKKDDFSLELKKNPDLLLELSKVKSKEQKLIGFAAETTEELERNALEKLTKKKLDLIVANNVLKSEIGFESDFNEVTIFGAQKKFILKKKKKEILAQEIWQVFLDLFLPTS